MNKKKFNRTLGEQSRLAIKVFHAVPKQEKWKENQIIAQLELQGTKINLRTLKGCLYTLAETGLIRESNGEWYQLKPKEYSKSPSADEQIKAIEDEMGEEHMKKANAAKKKAAEKMVDEPRTPFDILADLSDQLKYLEMGVTKINDQANQLRNVASQFKENLEAAAIEIEECMERKDAEIAQNAEAAEQLNMLQTIFTKTQSTLPPQ